jgi:hypothetical protein
MARRSRAFWRSRAARWRDPPLRRLQDEDSMASAAPLAHLLAATGWLVQVWFNYYAIAPLLLLPLVARAHRAGAAPQPSAWPSFILPEFEDPELLGNPGLHVLKPALCAGPGLARRPGVPAAGARPDGGRLAAIAIARRGGDRRQACASGRSAGWTGSPARPSTAATRGGRSRLSAAVRLAPTTRSSA